MVKKSPQQKVQKKEAPKPKIVKTQKSSPKKNSQKIVQKTNKDENSPQKEILVQQEKPLKKEEPKLEKTLAENSSQSKNTNVDKISQQPENTNIEEIEPYRTPPKEDDIPLIEKQPSEAQAPTEIKSYTSLVEIPGNPSLIYPEEARKQKQEGSVTILYFVDDSGLVEQIQLLESSGFPNLDNAALRTYSRHQFLPGQSGWYKQQVHFKLNQPS